MTSRVATGMKAFDYFCLLFCNATASLNIKSIRLQYITYAALKHVTGFNPMGDFFQDFFEKKKKLSLVAFKPPNTPKQRYKGELKCN